MLKKLSLLSFFTLMPASYYFAQTTVFGYLKDADGKPVENAEVDLKGKEDVTADKIGYFQFVDLQPGHYQVVITKPSLETKVMEFDVEEEKKKDLGVITLYSALANGDPGVVLVDNSTNDDENSSQSSTVGLLQSSQDVFSRIASYDLGAYWFRPRGIDGRNGDYLLNGASMAKSDNGSIDFGNWGGLNEITRYPEIAANHAPSEYAFGGADGVIYKNTKASEYRKGLQFTYSLTNRNYRDRVALRYTSGMSKSGWAFTAMGVRRWAKEGIQEGTFYDGYGAYLGIEKKFNDSHTITLNAIGAPTRRSTASPNTQEVYDLMGVHYNSYWGYQDGEKRSERVKKSFQPILQFQDFWKIGKHANLWTSLSYQFGKDKASRLDWQGVPNPSPTYYRNLPGYHLNYINSSVDYFPGTTPADYTWEMESYYKALNDWKTNDTSVTQINWDNLYLENWKNKNFLFGGGTSYEVTGNNSVYYLVNDVSDDKIWNAATHYTYDFNDKTRFLLNLSYQNYKSEQYREVADLLGGSYVLNRDAFANGSYISNPLQTSEYNELKKLGLYNEGEADIRKVKGDKMTYDYIFRRQEVKVNPGIKFSAGRFDALVTGMANYSSSSREGLFHHYLYENSYGKSADYNFWDFGLKGQLVYKINGRNFLVYNGAYFTQAPYLEDLFVNARVNNRVMPGIRSMVTNANDLSYVMNTPFVKMRLTGFLVDSENETNVQRFFVDGLQLDGQNVSAFMTQVMNNVQRRNMGVEFGIDYKVTPTISLQGLANYGQYTYRNNPDVYLMSDVSGDRLRSLGTAYLKNYRQGGTPQQAYALGFRYSSPKYWWFGASWNYLDDNYLDPSPALRSDNFIQNPYTHTPYLDITDAQDSNATVRSAIAPVKLPSSFFLNANAGKSWMLGKYYVMISATVNNILDNKKYITGGFEQTRNAAYPDYVLDKGNANPSFAPKYFYNQGRSYFINLQVRFK